MENPNFAQYILNERRLTDKMEILLHFKKMSDCFFDNSVIFKTEICNLFLAHCNLDVDPNVVLTACLMYGCKKSTISFDINKVKTYAEEGSKYLKELGFDEKFCKMCLEVNRYKPTKNREKEGDILELIDNFGMLLYREDRRIFSPIECLFILEHTNLQGKENAYLKEFKNFVLDMEEMQTVQLENSKIITRLQNKINSIPKYSVAEGINIATEYRTESKKIYLECKKIEKNKDRLKDRRQEIFAERRLEKELAEQLEQKHKFTDLLDGE